MKKEGSLLPSNKNGCPFLILAPMEGVGDTCFRKAIASIGGFDEAVRDFLRVPSNAHVESLAVRYEAGEIFPIPLAAQIMGSDPFLMAEMAREIEKRGATRIDVNCGCPSNTVTGRGAGSSLLKEPGFLHEIIKSVVEAVSIPVTAKLRSGFDDTSLFEENLLAAEESGIAFLTLHPRTKADGYTPPARWDLIRKAKEILKIPVVGNGDILTVEDAKKMLHETNCDALMIGRGAVINPFIFCEIKADYAKTPYFSEFKTLARYIEVYVSAIPEDMPLRNKLSKLKQMASFLFKKNASLMQRREEVLRLQPKSLEDFLTQFLPLLKSLYL